MKTKKQFTKRILSLVLAFVMVVGLMPMTALASTTLQKDIDGYYLIGNENDLFAFAALVNDGEYGANGKLTADITMTGETKP